MDILKSVEKSRRRHFCIENKKIRCTLTGHEMPPSADALLAYAGGKKFARALANHAAGQSAPPDLAGKFLTNAATIEARGGKQKAAKNPEEQQPASSARLFCQLTCRFLSDTPVDVARHLAGRRFRAALSAYSAARAAGHTFRPNTSLYAKYRARMTLEGLAGAKGCGQEEAALQEEGDDEDGDVGEDNDDEEQDEPEEEENNELLLAEDEDKQLLEQEVTQEDAEPEEAQLPPQPLRKKRKAETEAIAPGKKLKKSRK